MKKHLFFLFSLLFIGNATFAQNRASCILGDTIKLNINNYRGTVNWQESSDNQTWTDISGSAAQLSFVPSTNSKWVRAKIEEENCPAFYEVPFEVKAMDTSVTGFQRANFSVEQLPGELISNDGNGLLMFELETNEFPISVGDWLSGFAEQLTMKKINAIVIHNGIVQVFTSESTVLVYDIPLNFGNITSGKVMGKVLDEDGDAVIMAKVKIGADSVYTDYNGVFILNNATMMDKIGYVKASKTGFFNGSRTFIPKQNGNIVEIRLLRKNLAGNFNSITGGTVNLENVQLQFPTNAITLNGLAYNGNVKVFVNYINPSSPNFSQEMPGNLIGNQYGNIRGLTSFGMIGVEMQNDNGQELQIASGQNVLVSVPLSSEMLTNAPDTIDLWSFNENEGIWQDEGDALKTGNNYVAQIPHFSFWNWDIPWEVVLLNGTVTDENGNPVSGVTINVSTLFVGIASDLTNNLGQYSGWVPSDLELNLTLYYDSCGTLNQLLNNSVIGSFNTDTILNFQEVQLPLLTKVFGSVQNCENQPLQNGYVVSYNQISFIDQGNFSFISCLTTDSILIVKTNPMEFGEWQTLNLNPGLNDLDTLTLCNGDTLVSGIISDIDGNVYNTVLIGDQEWMAENLKTTRYADGTLIPNVTNNADWSFQNTGAWCYYNNIVSNGAIYGKLYNWHAVANQDNVCPAGWHVPSLDEWETLIDYLGGTEIAGGKMKSISSWVAPNLGATNLSGFSGLPGGYRNNSGGFAGTNFTGNWWSSVEFNSNRGNYFSVTYNYTSADRGDQQKVFGLSVRCVRD